MASKRSRRLIWALGLISLVASHSASAAVQPVSADVQNEPDAFATFVPNKDRIDHHIDYSIWTEALRNYVVSMGPPLRITPNFFGARGKRTHSSFYRLEGSKMGFSFMDEAVRDSFTLYRAELESLSDQLDIQSLPRNEQLAYWFNLHNVAIVEQIAKNWPIYEPRMIEIDGVTLDEAKFLKVEGIALSPRDIREKIVYPNWRDPRVIYGFWRGEIGGPAMMSEAFEAQSISPLLDRAATDFVNSLRGTEKRGKTLHVSRLYTEAAEFYFPDLNVDLRKHLLRFSNEIMTKRITRTTQIKTSIWEHDIADLAGGSKYKDIRQRWPYPTGVLVILARRQKKFQYMRRKDIPIGTVIVEFKPIDLPGQPAPVDEIE